MSLAGFQATNSFFDALQEAHRFGLLSLLIWEFIVLSFVMR